MLKDGKDLSIPVNEQEELLNTLRERFNTNMDRHKGLGWEEIEERLLFME